MANNTFQLNTEGLNQPERYIEELELSLKHTPSQGYGQPNYITNSPLDDAVIIQKFVEGKGGAIANKNIQIQHTNNQLCLINADSDVISFHTYLDKIRSVSIKVGSKYGDLLHKVLIRNNFILFGKSKQKGFIEYQQYVPVDGHKVNCTEATVLWRNWSLSKRHDSNHKANANILIFTENEWSYIQDIVSQENRFYVKTQLGNLTLNGSDKTVWSTQGTNKNITEEHHIPQEQTPVDAGHLNLEDAALIQSFVQGNKQPIFNQNIQISLISDGLQLSTRKSEVIAVFIFKNNLRYILLKIDSEYNTLIHEILTENYFFSIGESQQKGFLEYQYHPLPEDYKINHTQAAILWKTWWPNQRYHNKHQLKLNILVFTRNNWYPIQNISISEGKIYIKTLVGEFSLPTTNKVTWAHNTTPINPIAKTTTNTLQAEAEITNAPEQKLSYELAQSKSVSAAIKPERETSNSGRKIEQPINPKNEADSNITSDNLLAKQKDKALQLLNDYLVNGATEVITEVVKNSQNEIISSKTVTIKKPCPQWVIELVSCRAFKLYCR